MPSRLEELGHTCGHMEVQPRGWVVRGKIRDKEGAEYETDYIYYWDFNNL